MYVVLYIALLFAGILFLVGGLFVTRLTWRTDIESYGRRSRPLQIALHPEKFVKPDRLGEIRLLNLLGGLLLLAALLVVCYDVFSALGGP